MRTIAKLELNRRRRLGVAAGAERNRRATGLVEPTHRRGPCALLSRQSPRPGANWDGGHALSCSADRRAVSLRCHPRSPTGVGFGHATLQMAPLFKMKPIGLNARPVDGGIIKIPVKFQLQVAADH